LSAFVRSCGHIGGPDAQQVADARRERAERLADARVDELLALWRAGEDRASAAGKLGLGGAACAGTLERFATDVDRAARRASLSENRGLPRYSDADIIDALTSVAAALGHAPSANEYAMAARRLGYPSLATVLNRMGGWSAAVRTAGLRSGAAAASRRTRRWTVEACWDALRRVVDELGEIPSVLAHERLAAGRSDLPSSATLRNRLGRWSFIAARLAAQRELAPQAQLRVRTASAALART